MRFSLHLVLGLPCRLVHSRSVRSRSVHSGESVVFQSCIVSGPYMYSFLGNVYDVIDTRLVSHPGITTVVM